MTNYEKYKDIIKKFQGNWVAFDKSKNKIVDCRDISCTNCAFCKFNSAYNNCKANAMKWAAEEYIEPADVDWSKVPVDTKIWVRDSENSKWYPRYFAKYEDGAVYTFYNGRTSWSSDDKVPWAYPWAYAKLAEVE